MTLQTLNRFEATYSLYPQVRFGYAYMHFSVFLHIAACLALDCRYTFTILYASLRGASVTLLADLSY